MALEGTIRDFAMRVLIQTLGEQKQSGVLVVKNGTDYVSLIFNKGFIVGVEALPKKMEFRLGEMLLRNGDLTSPVLEKTLAIQKKTGKKLGEILLGLNLVTLETLKKGLNSQALQMVISTMGWKEGEYKFHKRESVEWDRDLMDPLPTEHVLMESMQILDELPIIREKIRNGRMVFRLCDHKKNLKILEDFEDEKGSSDETIYLSKQEYEILKRVDGRKSVTDLINSLPFPEFFVLKGLYSLLNKGLMEECESSGALQDRLSASDDDLLSNPSLLTRILAPTLMVIALASLLWTVVFKANPFHPLKAPSTQGWLDEYSRIQDRFLKAQEGFSSFHDRQP